MWRPDCTCWSAREKKSVGCIFTTMWMIRRLFVCWLSFVTAQCGLQFSSRGMRPGITTVLARHLDKNTMGYLQWRWGIQSSMNTSIVRDTKSSHFTFAMQVSTQQLYLILAHFKINCCLSGLRQNNDFSFASAAWDSSHFCDDELPVQVPGWRQDED